MSSTRNLSETTRNLILTEIQTNISSKLAGVAILRPDGTVSLEDPKSYFIYAPAAGYMVPAIFVIVDNIDFRKEQKGANFIAAMVRVNINVIVEDIFKDLLVVKCERYQAALHEILDQALIVSSDNNVKIGVIIKRATFSDVYAQTGSADYPSGFFRKEVALECDVEHYENF